MNGERISYGDTGTDQTGSSNSPGTGAASNEATVTHNGDATATWEMNSNIANDFNWKMRIYLKGAYYDHCDYSHSEDLEE